MLVFIRELIMQAKNLLSGAFATTINGFQVRVPSELIDLSFLNSTTSFLGLSIPTFFLYFFLTSDE